MKRYEMIKDKRYFSYIIKNGKFVKNNFFVIYFIDNNNGYSHFGIAIKNSIGKAFIRNKLKRRVRMIIENNKNLFKLSKDYIIMIRDGCLGLSYKELECFIISLMKGEIL